MFRRFIVPSSTRSSFFRFCSSSSQNTNNSNVTISRLKNLALCVIPPSGTWMKISDVARQLPDDFFDELPDDVAGLRGLLELCDPNTEAVITFRNNSNSNGSAGPLEVSRQLPIKDSKQTVPSLMDAPPVPIDFSTSSLKNSGLSDSEVKRLERIAQAERMQKEASAAAKEKRRSKHEEILQIARERAESRKNMNNSNNKHQQVANAAAAAPMPQLNQIQKGISIPEIEIERAQVRSLTSFHIPLVEAANDHFRHNNNHNSNGNDKNSDQDESKNDQNENTLELSQEEIVKRVCDFLIWIEPAKHMIDLFHTTQDPWKSLREKIEMAQQQVLEQNDNNIKNASTATTTKTTIFDNFYISVLPPFQGSHCPLDGETKFAEFKAHEYDLYRLARFLSTTFFVSLKSLLDSDVQDILQKPLLQVVASFPHHFEFIPEGAPVPESEERKPSTVEQVVKGGEALGLPIVKVGSSLSNNNNTNTPDSDFSSSSFGYVRYILPHDQFTTSTKCSFSFRNAKLEELEQAMVMVKKAAKYSHVPDDGAPEELGILKVFPTGPRRQSFKQELTRALNLRRFPRGNVFFDRNVIAHYIFDTIPVEEAVPFEKYKSEFLGNRTRNVAPMYGNFPTLYPHLFHAFQDERGDWFLQRADSTHLVKVKPVDEITVEEVVMGIAAAKPKRLDPMRPFQASTCMYKMTKIVQKACKQKFGGINNVIRTNPKRFTVVQADPTNGNLGALFLFNEEISQEVCDRFGLKKKDDGTYEVCPELKKSAQMPKVDEAEDSTGAPKLKETPPAPEEKSKLKKAAEVEKNPPKEGENLWDHFAKKE